MRTIGRVGPLYRNLHAEKVGSTDRMEIGLCTFRAVEVENRLSTRTDEAQVHRRQLTQERK